MSDDSSSDVPAAKQQVLDAGAIHWDLREPPTKQQVGLPDGEDTLIYEYDDDRTIETRLRLPDDQTLAVDARYVGVSAILSGPPSIDLQFWTDSFERAQHQLAATVEQFGLSEDALAGWQREVAAAERTQDSARVKTGWLSTRLGELTLSVQGRYSPVEETAAVSYQLSWGR